MITISPQGSGRCVMGKASVAEKTANCVAEVVEETAVEAVAAPAMTVEKSEIKEVPRKITLDEKIPLVEDLMM